MSRFDRVFIPSVAWPLKLLTGALLVVALGGAGVLGAYGMVAAVTRERDAACLVAYRLSVNPTLRDRARDPADPCEAIAPLMAGVRR